MSDIVSGTGTCLCGAVTLKVEKVGERFIACHCGTCRQWSGGPLMAVDCGDGVAVEGKESLGVFDSSSWADRGFCKKCGTHLFYRLKEKQQYQIPIGLFQDTVSPEFSLQVFIDKKPENYAFANETREWTEAQVMEMFAPKE